MQNWCYTARSVNRRPTQWSANHSLWAKLTLHITFRKISASQIWSSGSVEEGLLYLHCSSAEKWSSQASRTSSEERLLLHLSISIGLHCIICLDHFNLILQRHVNGDIVTHGIYILSAVLLWIFHWFILQASSFPHRKRFNKLFQFLIIIS